MFWWQPPWHKGWCVTNGWSWDQIAPNYPLWWGHKSGWARKVWKKEIEEKSKQIILILWEYCSSLIPFQDSCFSKMSSDQWPCPIQCLVANYTPSPLQFQDEKKPSKITKECKRYWTSQKGHACCAQDGALWPTEDSPPAAVSRGSNTGAGVRCAHVGDAPTHLGPSYPRSASWAPVANVWLFLEVIHPKYFWGSALIVLLYQTFLVTRLHPVF